MESSPTTQIDMWPAQVEHLHQLKELGATYYPMGHPALTDAYLSWFYLDNPAGPASLVVAHENGVWIGLIALIPIRLLTQGQDQRACFAVNVLSHPDHRGKNLFVKMIRCAKERLSQQGVWLLGHPNGNALPGWKRQKMEFQAPLRLRLVRPAWPFSGLQLKTLTSVEELHRLSADVWRSGSQRADTHVPSSAEFMAWRFISAPHRQYRIVAVYRRQKILGLRVTRRFKGPVDLMVDACASMFDLGSVMGSVRRPTLLMHSGGGASQAAAEAGSWALSTQREFPFFVTRWQPGLPAIDAAGISLAASDF